MNMKRKKFVNGMIVVFLISLNFRFHSIGLIPSTCTYW